jgi:dephospho-CoA kinase
MLIVSLTGGIATGKSVVARFLAARGCHIHEADQVARALMDPGRPAWRKVADHFGPGILNADRTIDRRRLAGIIFTDAKERRFMDELIHPLVLEEMRKAAAALESEGRTKVFVSEAALTVEAGFTRYFDKVVVAWCRPEVQLRRLMARDKIDREDALKRIGSQMGLEEKKKHADYLVDTSGDPKDTELRTETVYRSLLADYERKGRPEG